LEWKKKTFMNTIGSTLTEYMTFKKKFKIEETRCKCRHNMPAALSYSNETIQVMVPSIYIDDMHSVYLLANY
jgi:hypothetical protein